MSPQWFALYTKARNEKKVVERLNALGICAYCPLQKVLKVWSDRKKWVEEPLFRSYVFVQLTPHRLHEVFQAPGVVRYIYWLGKPAVVRDRDMEAIRLFLSDFGHEKMVVEPLAREDRILIQSGPLMGREGIIKDTKNKVVKIYLTTLDFVVKVSTASTLIKKIA